MSNFLKSLQGEVCKIKPVWLMRQAGRYLPEYLELRAKSENFLHFCYSPQMACEATLQPIRRFGFDAAILFSDILVVPDALGVDVQFVKNEGPRLSKTTTLEHLKSLKIDGHDHLNPVFETISLIKSKLDPKTPLIGFCGAPWTVATYMIGGGGDNQLFGRAAIYRDPKFVLQLLDIIADFSVIYLSKQVQAGVDVIQIFDSWAGVLNSEHLEMYSVYSMKRLISKFKKLHPDVPVIGFFKGFDLRDWDKISSVGANAYGFDWGYSAQDIDLALAKDIVVQGNLDPAALVGGGDGLLKAIDDILEAFENRPHVFNLGHGIVPQTPLAHVEQLLNRIRNHVI